MGSNFRTSTTQIPQKLKLFTHHSQEVHAFFSPASFESGESGSSDQHPPSNSASQFVHAFRGRQGSTSCLSCDFASFRLQFQPFSDAEAELCRGITRVIHRVPL